MDWLPKIEMAVVDFGAWAIRVAVVIIVAALAFAAGHMAGVGSGYRNAVKDYRAGQLECIIKLHYPDQDKEIGKQ